MYTRKIFQVIESSLLWRGDGTEASLIRIVAHVTASY